MAKVTVEIQMCTTYRIAQCVEIPARQQHADVYNKRIILQCYMLCLFTLIAVLLAATLNGVM